MGKPYSEKRLMPFNLSSYQSYKVAYIFSWVLWYKGHFPMSIIALPRSLLIKSSSILVNLGYRVSHRFPETRSLIVLWDSGNWWGTLYENPVMPHSNNYTIEIRNAPEVRQKLRAIERFLISFTHCYGVVSRKRIFQLVYL